MPRVPRSRRDGEEKCTAAVQTNGKIDFAQISNILEGAVDVLGNDKSKLATLENLLKTALEKVAKRRRFFCPRLRIGLAKTQKRDPHQHHLSPFQRRSIHR